MGSFSPEFSAEGYLYEIPAKSHFVIRSDAKDLVLLDSSVASLPQNDRKRDVRAVPLLLKPDQAVYQWKIVRILPSSLYYPVAIKPHVWWGRIAGALTGGHINPPHKRLIDE